MSEDFNVELVAEAMYALVQECHGKRNLKPLDLTRAMIEKFGPACDKALCKDAIGMLLDDDRCQYSYVGGGSYIVLRSE
jgi:hypothetical protein